MMIHDFQPYLFVEHRGFSELMQKQQPHYQIPHRQTFPHLLFFLCTVYREVKIESKLRNVLQSKNKISQTGSTMRISPVQTQSVL